jgi:hypothetical protein
MLNSCKIKKNEDQDKKLNIAHRMTRLYARAPKPNKRCERMSS